MAKTADPQRRPVLGILTLTVGFLVTASLLSSPPWEGARPALGIPRDACGLVGRMTAGLLLGELGTPLTIWGGLLWFAFGFRWLTSRPRRPGLFLLWSGPTALALSLFGGLLTEAEPWGAQPIALGRSLASPGFLGPFGSTLTAAGILLVLVLIGVGRWVPLRLRQAGRTAVAGSSAGALRLGGRLFQRPARRELTQSVAAPAGSIWESAGSPADQAAEPAVETTARGPSRIATLLRGTPRAEPDEAPADAGTGTKTPVRAGPLEELAPADRARPLAEPPSRAGAKAPEAPSRADAEVSARRGDGPTAELPAKAATKAPRRDEAPVPLPDGESYVLPPVALLERGEAPGPIDRDELLETSRVLVRTLKDFGIQGQVGQIHPGPVVTQYEYEPGTGVKVAQIVSRAEDLALALRASRIRLVAPIPGKAAVGIEVPNRSAARISLRSVLDEIDLAAIPGELPLVFGRDIRGRPYAARLEQMPHLLVAGTTGSGKSVFLNAALLSLLMRRTPDELRLLLIDPKMLELTPYDGIPHLICPVVTEARVAARMLAWVVTEMEGRYRRLAAVGVRNLESYRARIARGGAEGLTPMPHIVVVVDELADLMLTLPAEIEGPIARLAQMARAVGIHLVLATQRPSVDVITGVIKANFPARIAFQVASKVDSRTILDANGAESLLGRGDMLFLPPGKAEAVRVHGAFVGEKDTEEVVAFLRPQPPAPALVREEALSLEDDGTDLRDELFEDALRLVVHQRQASVSFLQRRLKIGYSRAGRLMDLLERAGAVGPPDGSKPREVMADEQFLDDWRRNEGRDATQPLA